MAHLIVYLLGMGLTVYLTMLYDSPLLAAVLALEILIPLPSCLIARQAAKGLEIRLAVPVPAAERKEEVTAELRLKNRSVFPVLRAEIRVSCRNRFHAEKKKESMYVRVDGKNQSRCQLRIASDCCGTLELCVEKAAVWDYLGILRFPVKSGQKESFSVFPPFSPLPVDIGAAIPGPAGESDEFDRQKGGDDPSEIFRIRPYQPGDRLQHIHWKMTARADELMVKEFSLPVCCQTAVFLDLKGEGEELRNWKNADAYLETALSLSFRLLEEGRRHYVVWYEKEAGELCRKRMDREEELYELALRLFRAMPYEENIDLEEFYSGKYPGEKYPASWRLDLRCRLWRGGVLEWEKTAP